MAAATVHASAAVVGDRGVLIRGASGTGKSSLLLALLTRDPRRAALVADDRVALSVANGRLLATVPDAIAGLLEVRGQGVRQWPHVSPVVIDLIVDLAPPDACPRMPEAREEQFATIEGLALARLFVPVGATDGAARVSLALDGRLNRNQSGIDAPHP